MNSTAILSSKKIRLVLTLVTMALLTVAGYYLFQNYSRMVETNNIKEGIRQEIKENQIVLGLPYKTPNYEITYRKEDSGHVTILISTSSPYFRFIAVQQINKIESGSYAKYKVVFVNYKNPAEKR